MKVTYLDAVKRVSYNPDTGMFTRLVSGGGYRAGMLAGWLNADGYRILSINRGDIYAHRLAFLLTTGEIPELVDHINGDRADNRWCNLRASSKTLNAQNMKRPMNNNKSGFLGVTNQKGKFVAVIRAAGRHKHLGAFDTAEAAHDAYLTAKRELHAANTL